MPPDIEKLRAGAVVYAECQSLARLRAEHPADPQIAAADAVWGEALAGRVDLVQRRKGKGFEYAAIGRRQVDPRPVQPVLASQGVRTA